MSERYIKRDIPWARVVAFHREIARRAEESFFQLALGNAPSDRWSAIHNFVPPNLSDTWTLQTDNLSEPAVRAWKQSAKALELYIGGPSWPISRKEQNGWRTDWCPFLYRAIRITFEEDGRCQLIPEQGTWDVSPIVYSVLERKGFAPPAPMDQLVANWLQVASGDQQDERKPVTKRLIDAISNDIPIFSELFAKQVVGAQNYAQQPSPWVIFAAPQGGKLTKHLVADYDRLLAVAGDPKANLGGLHLFEGYPDVEPSNQQEPSPIVALNDSQRTAVRDILAARPVTVISGPPGCGKSQVVLSLLLNAWQRGTSVLFSSNNNQAVDVVRERIKRFEENFPIAVRAGSQSRSSLIQSLRDTLNYITGGQRRDLAAGKEVKDKQAELVLKAQELRRIISSKLPQRIDEAVRSALGAYGTYKATCAELQKCDNALDEEYRSFGIPSKPEVFWAKIGEPLEKWLGDIPRYKALIEQDDLQRTQLKKQEGDHLHAYEAGLHLIGLDAAKLPVANPTRNSSPEAFADWFTQYEALLRRPLERNLEPYHWEEGYLRWNGEKDALDWAQQAKRFMGEIRRQCGELGGKHLQVEDVRLRMAKQKEAIDRLGIPANLQITPELIGQWATAYATDTALPERRRDWLPWSERQQARRGMRKAEKSMRKIYPLAIWREIGRLDPEGRGKLSEIVEQTRYWIELREEWNAASPLCARIEEAHALLRGQAGELKAQASAPTDFVPALWLEYAEQINGEAQFAARAAEGWKRRTEATSAKEAIGSVAGHYFSLDLADPVKEGWAAGHGREFTSSIKAMLEKLSPESVIHARSICYAAGTTAFIDSWKQTRDAQKRYQAVSREMECLPKAKHRHGEWLAEKPPVLSGIADAPPDSFPPDNHPLFLRLKSFRDWHARWTDHRDRIAPQHKKKIGEELSWAREKLQAAIELLPVGAQRQQVQKTFATLFSANSEWPTAEIQRVFEEFNPVRIAATIESFDAQIEALSFKIAKFDWFARMAADRKIQEALDELHRHYKLNQERLDPSAYAIFHTALQALPVWITTAMSPQSIPMEPGVFDILVIDEATQCTVTNILPLIYRAKRLVVIGDSEQLPAIPTIRPAAEIALATKCGFEPELLNLVGHAENDLYRAAIQCLPQGRHSVVNLDEHYRSHPLIIGFSNQHVYQARLKLNTKPATSDGLPFGSAVHGQSVRGLAEPGPYNSSWQNKLEARAVCELVNKICSAQELNSCRIGVVTPFRPQEELIRDGVLAAGHSDRVEVGTVHDYQGDERDIMIFSPVISRGISAGAARWVENPRNLINVAITRARTGLFVVADFDVCRGQTGILGSLIKYVEAVELLRKTSRDELELFSWMVVQGWNPQVHRKEGNIEIDFVLTNEGTRLAIEVDGHQHEQTTEADNARDAFLRGLGYDVLRVPARAVRETPSLVIKQIAEKIGFHA